MSKGLRMRCMLSLCGVLTGVFGLALTAGAEVTSDSSGSVLVYPKVMYSDSEGGRDTIIQLSNTSNNPVYAHCFYVDSREIFGRPLWQVTDFRLVLTKQQPTHWVASMGRSQNNNDNFQTPTQDGAGLDPGGIPPVTSGFQGELKCVQTDASGTPFGGNSLKGEAVLRSRDGDVSKYNALGIIANPDFASDGDPDELLLNNTANFDGEYNSCSNMVLMDHFADGAPACPIETCLTPSNVCSGSGAACAEDSDCPITCPIRPYLTMVPCQQDLENLIPESVTVQFAITNEFENNFSTSTTVDCWENTRLADIDVGNGNCTGSTTPCSVDSDCITGLCDKTNSVFSFAVLGSNSAFTTITPVGLDGGIIAIGEEQHYSQGAADRAWAAWNLHQMGTRFDATDTQRVDRIRIPQQF